MQFTLSTNADDNLVGGADNDVFVVGATIGRLAETDTVNGGGGVDTVLFQGATVSLAASRLNGLTSIEALDFTAATGGLSVALDAHAVGQASGDTLTLSFGANAMLLDVAAVRGGGDVVLAGSGLVTLRNFEGQSVRIGDGVGGQVMGGSAGDHVRGGAGDDKVDGGLGDDQITGAAGADTLTGGAGNDLLDGGEGADSLVGGDGFDLIRLGAGADVAVGGAGSDTFRLSVGGVATIADFNASDGTELIDLRGFAGIASFADLTVGAAATGAVVSAAGLSLTLMGVTAGSLGDGNFVFAGESLQTVAEALTVAPLAKLTAGVDVIAGTAGADVFELPSSIENLTAADRIVGGAGVDTLRFASPSTSLGGARLAGVSSVERLDLSQASTTLSVALDAAAVAQAEGDTLTLAFGRNAMTLDVSAVGSAGVARLAGVGVVTLRNFAGQNVSVEDGYDSRIIGGMAGDTMIGGSGHDAFTGNDGADSLQGGGGADSVIGGDGADALGGGAGDDRIVGDGGNDRLSTGGGVDIVTGGSGLDVFRVGAGASVTVTDFEEQFQLERIDLREVATATSFQQLTITDTGAGAKVEVGGASVLLSGVVKADLGAGNFVFAGQADPTTIFVAAGTDQDVIQRLIDDADAGTTIQLGAGTFEFDHTLLIGRSDITVRGAGQDATLIKSLIGDANASETILVKSGANLVKVADVAATGAEGASAITLSSTQNLKVGDILYLTQANDDAYLAASGNTGLIFPEDYATNPQNYALREVSLKIVAVNGDTVTLEKPLPYTFEAGAAWAGTSKPLRNVDIGGFRIETTFAPADPILFANTREAWTSIATVAFDNVADSFISDVATYNTGSHAFRFQSSYNITGDNLLAKDTQNKGPDSNGYGFYFNEAFNNTLTNVRDENMRHSVLFSSFNAEHYNTIQVLSTNRDINFHGSADSDNTIVVESSIALYGDGEVWKAVGPGKFPVHPQSTVEANDVRFRVLRSGELPELVYGVNDGADLATGGGADTVFGGAGRDTLFGADGNDMLYGAGGGDLVQGFTGLDILSAGAGVDTVQGGDGADIVDGGLDADVADGGAGDDVVVVGAGDVASGGLDSDTFIVTGSATIADFAVADPYEKIDLRGLAAATGFEALSIAQLGADAQVSVGGVSILLRGVTASGLSAEDFVFVGQAPNTLAREHTTLPSAQFTSFADTIVGTAGNDLFDGSGNSLTSVDRIDGAGGVDTVRFTSVGVGLSGSTMSGLRSIERLDVSQATGAISIQADAAAVSQSGDDRLVVFGGVRNMLLDTSAVGSGGTVIAETFGLVTLRDAANQSVTVSDQVRGRIAGGAGGDGLFGGALSDTLAGGLGADRLTGSGGGDLLDGGADSDILAGGAGGDTLRGGAGADLIDAGEGIDVLVGGDGDDLLILGAGDTAAGGIDSDTFLIAGGGAIDDFAVGDAYERIDLRGIATATGFSALTIVQAGADARVTVGGVTVVLRGVAASSLSADDFLFVGDGSVTLGRQHTTLAQGQFTSLADVLAGAAGNDVFDGTANSLTNLDRIDGAGGIDTVRFTSTAVGLNGAALSALRSIERLDVSQASAGISIQVDAASVAQSSDDRLVVFGGLKDILLDVSAVGAGGVVVAETFGVVTLRNLANQAVTVSDAVNGRVAGGSGADAITGGALADTLSGGAAGDRLLGGGGVDLLDGGTGADTLFGGLGGDRLVGGLGDDTYLIDSAGDVLVEAAGGGADTVLSAVTFILGAGIENLTLTGSKATNGSGNSAANVITGNQAANLLNGGAGADRLIGGVGDDVYVVDDAGDRVVEAAGQGQDTVVSTVSYALTAGQSVEVLQLSSSTGIRALNLTGNEITNTLIGNRGANLLSGGGGADKMAGGLGDDTYVVDTLRDRPVELVGQGMDTLVSSTSYVLLAGQEVEVLQFSSSAAAGLSLTGNAFANTVIGNRASNVLSGGAGVDTLIGGAGNDIYLVDSAGDRVVEAAVQGVDTVVATVSYALAAGQEIEVLQFASSTRAAALSLAGNELSNTLIGNKGANLLDGAAGADKLIGGLGDDVYVIDSARDRPVEAVGQGRDTLVATVSYTLGAGQEVEVLQFSSRTGAAALNLVGNEFANTLIGNKGANLIGGAGGSDVMAGGAGADMFVFSAPPRCRRGRPDHGFRGRRRHHSA